MKRNRIVINLDESQTPAGSGRGRGTRRGLARLLLIAAVVLLLLAGVVVGGGYLWWQNHKSSPAYALAVLADAAQKNDTAMVDSILDTSKVCDDLVAQVRDSTGGSAASSIASVLPGRTAAVQTVSPKLEQTVHDELLQEVKRLTEPAKDKPFFLVALGITRFADIKEENNVAQVKVNVKDEQLQLTMQPTTRPGATRWRITAVQDDKLVKLIADGIMRKLPAPGIQLPDEIHKQLK